MALEQGYWTTCKDCLASLSPTDRKKILQNLHVLQGIPTLHYLAKLPMREDDINLVDEIVRLLADSGYDINQKVSSYCVGKISNKFANYLNFPGFFIKDCTALIAAVAKRNNVLVKCLIQNGARKDLLDSKGQSAFHWAISNGNISCLKDLIYLRTFKEVDETEQIKDLISAYSLLQKAVESGQKEIVAFLIEKQLYDPNKKAILVISSDHLNKFDVGVSIPLELIPVQFAILKRQWDIAAYLIRNRSDISVVANFKKEHSCYIHWNCTTAGDLNSYELLLKMETKKALPALEAMLEQGIEKALNCPGGKILSAAVKGNQPDFVERIFNHYAKKPFNDQSPSWLRIVCTDLFRSPIVEKLRSPAPYRIENNWVSSIGEYTLLHFACIHECTLDFIKKLVELRADVNSKTTGITKLTPLHISIVKKQWEHARYLIDNGADLQSTAVFNRNDGIIGTIQYPNSIRLLLYLTTGCKECCSTTHFFLTLMDQNKEKLKWVGVGELDFAIANGSLPQCVLNLVNHCATTTPVNDLMWYSFKDTHPSPIRMPLLHAVFSFIGPCGCPHINSNLGCLIRSLATAPYNYNLNSVPEAAIERLRVTDYIYDKISSPIFFHILARDYIRTNNSLTKTLLAYDHVELNVRNLFSQNPVEYVLHVWSVDYRSYLRDEIQEKVNFVFDTVKVLLFKGSDVTSVIINEKFPYHNGELPMIQLLYRAGANITPSFFSPRPDIESNLKDIQFLKTWIDDFNQKEKLTLQHHCRLLVRSSIKTVGDAKSVMTKQPIKLKNYVLKLHEWSHSIN